MKLSEWAKQQGIGYQTAWMWHRDGILPVSSRQLPTGTILVDVPSKKVGTTVIYSRVSSNDQKANLEGQISRCLVFANEQGLLVAETISEIGSFLNGHRKGLMRLLGNPEVDTIVVEHKDRLMRFGAEYVEAALASRGGKLLVVDTTELKDDLVTDMMSVLTSFCARLYGRQSAVNRAKKALEAAAGSTI